MHSTPLVPGNIKFINSQFFLCSSKILLQHNFRLPVLQNSTKYSQITQKCLHHYNTLKQKATTHPGHINCGSEEKTATSRNSDILIF